MPVAVFHHRRFTIFPSGGPRLHLCYTYQPRISHVSVHPQNFHFHAQSNNKNLQQGVVVLSKPSAVLVASPYLKNKGRGSQNQAGEMWGQLAIYQPDTLQGKVRKVNKSCQHLEVTCLTSIHIALDSGESGSQIHVSPLNRKYQSNTAKLNLGSVWQQV